MPSLPTNGAIPLSPVRDLLGTNATITPGQEALIAKHLVGPLKDLADLALKIESVQQHLALLEEQRNVLEEHVQAHQVLMRPIRSLPDEVLQEIFAQCLPAHYLPILSSSTAPLLLTQICQSWRALALSTPFLWYGIHIAVPTANSPVEALKANTNRVLAIKQWLVRARAQENDCQGKLHVSLHWSSRMQPCPGTRSWYSLLLRDYASQIRVLELDLPDNRLFPFMDAFARPDSQFDSRNPILANMKRLVLHLASAPSQASRGGHVASRNKFWRECSALKEVVWHGVDDDVLRLPLDWKSVEEVQVSCSGSGLVGKENETGHWGGYAGVWSDAGGVGRANVEMSFFTHAEALSLARGAQALRKLALQLNFEDSTRRANISAKTVENQPSSSGGTILEEDDSDRDFHAANRDPIQLKDLTDLSLRDTYLDADDIPLFLLGVQLPQLKTLDYELAGFPPRDYSWQLGETPGMEEWRGHDGDPSPPLLRFLHNQLQLTMTFGDTHRSVHGGLKITRFRIHARSISQHALIECLKLMVRLEDLWVFDSGDLTWRMKEDMEDLDEDETYDPWKREKQRGEFWVYPDDMLLEAFLPPSQRKVFALYSEENEVDTMNDSDDDSFLPSHTSPPSSTPSSSFHTPSHHDSESEKREIADAEDTLCPQLTSLKFDRTIFSIDFLKRFVEVRNRLADILRAASTCEPSNVRHRKLERLWIGFFYPRPEVVDSTGAALNQQVENAFKDLDVTPSFRFAEPDKYRWKREMDSGVDATEGLRWNV